MLRSLLILIAVLGGLLLQPGLPQAEAPAPGAAPAACDLLLADCAEAEDEADLSQSSPEVGQFLLPVTAGFRPPPLILADGAGAGRLRPLRCAPLSRPPRA